MTYEPKRIQLRRTKGWRKPEGAIVVARPSKWGNPFRPQMVFGSGLAVGFTACGPGADINASDTNWTSLTACAGWRRLHATEAHWECLADCVALFEKYAETVDVSELRGRDLACWCPLDRPCHADVLLRLANS